jgi:hypothetical protein
VTCKKYCYLNDEILTGNDLSLEHDFPVIFENHFTCFPLSIYHC